MARTTGKEVRNESQSALTLRVPKEVHEALRTTAYATDASINEIVLRAIRDYLGNEGHRRKVEGFLRKSQTQWRVALDKLADL
jgi:hypothetical protein